MSKNKTIEIKTSISKPRLLQSSVPQDTGDMLESRLDHFREQRAQFRDELGQWVLDLELSLEEAVQFFRYATQWPDDKVRQYLKLTSGPKSPFKKL